MAVRAFALSTLWSTISARASHAQAFALSKDITKFIPVCAADCFDTFLQANYAPTTCGSAPSLQCLCSHNGATGFTVGEGAVQCIVAENSLGACQNMGFDCESTSSMNTQRWVLTRSQLNQWQRHTTCVLGKAVQ